MELNYGSVENETKSPSLREIKLLARHRMDKATIQLNAWEFPGWGKNTSVQVNKRALQEIEYNDALKNHELLTEWPATAISGNDILSSCLYVSGFVACKAGILAPVASLLVSCILYFYRFIYIEVLECVPMNGGSYNALLNTTNKRTASFAASLALLSYIATAVVSGASACLYLQMVFPSVNVMESTIALLAFFGVLNFYGIAESSITALGIFVIHALTLCSLCIVCIVAAFRNPSIFLKNWSLPYPSVDIAGTTYTGDFFTSLFFGLSSAMLGVSGFETSSQFVEEQAPGVFPKTLKNMWIGVTIFNPLLSFLSLSVLPLYGQNSISQHRDTVLAKMGEVVLGERYGNWICIDAFIVLSGAVLTSYVGITGLVRRLAGDRVLPEFFLLTNRWRSTNHFIILTFFVISSSLVYLLHGNIETLSGVFTFSFLSLMMFFGYGCLLLKFKRSEIPREKSAPLYTCILGIFFVGLGLLGNLLGDPVILSYFLIYLLIVVSTTFIMLNRISLLNLLLSFLQYAFPSSSSSPVPEDQVSILGIVSTPPNARTGARGGRTITNLIRTIHSYPILFFCKCCHLPTINQAVLYVLQNEDTSHLIVVHVYKTRDESTLTDFSEAVGLFDCMYTKLKIDFMSIEGEFSPSLITWLATEYHIPQNMMFIKQPDRKFRYKIETLGGVRVIL